MRTLRIWRMSYADDASGSGVVQTWHPSKANAEHAAKAVLEQSEDAAPDVDLRIIPTDKEGLIDWLNCWATSF